MFIYINKHISKLNFSDAICKGFIRSLKMYNILFYSKNVKDERPNIAN